LACLGVVSQDAAQPRGVHEVEIAQVQDQASESGVAHAGELGVKDRHRGEIQLAHGLDGANH
jgi:hypothetical protein